MWQFARAVEGMGEACRALDIPITGGNVSLYNETDGRGVLPTPVIGVVGLLEDASQVVRRPFRASGDVVVLLGRSRAEFGGSEYLHVVHGMVRGVPPILELGPERALQGLLVDLATAGLVSSAHDCAEGGLAVALSECCFDSQYGVEANVTAVDDVDAALKAAGLADVAALFGESASRVVVSAPEDHTADLLAKAAAAGVPAAVIGRVGGDRVRIAVAGQMVIDEPREQLEQIWASSIGSRFERVH
jgi:phosphoribosylformylglycinamidine synthase